MAEVTANNAWFLLVTVIFIPHTGKFRLQIARHSCYPQVLFITELLTTNEFLAVNVVMLTVHTTPEYL